MKNLEPKLQSLFDTANWYGYAIRKGKAYHAYQIQQIADRIGIKLTYTQAQ